MVGYLWSLWLNISLGIYKKTFFPLILLVSGGANHLLIFLSRYIFEKEDYALSSDMPAVSGRSPGDPSHLCPGFPNTQETYQWRTGKTDSACS